MYKFCPNNLKKKQKKISINLILNNIFIYKNGIKYL